MKRDLQPFRIITIRCLFLSSERNALLYTSVLFPERQNKHIKPTYKFFKTCFLQTLSLKPQSHLISNFRRSSKKKGSPGKRMRTLWMRTTRRRRRRQRKRAKSGGRRCKKVAANHLPLICPPPHHHNYHNSRQSESQKGWTQSHMSAGRWDTVPNLAGAMELNWGHIQTSGQLIGCKILLFFFILLPDWMKQTQNVPSSFAVPMWKTKQKVWLVSLMSSSGLFCFFTPLFLSVGAQLIFLPFPPHSRHFCPLLFIVDCNSSDNHDGKGAKNLLHSFWFTLRVAPTDFLEISEKRHYGGGEVTPWTPTCAFLISETPLVFHLFFFFGAVPIGWRRRGHWNWGNISQIPSVQPYNEGSRRSAAGGLFSQSEQFYLQNVFFLTFLYNV